MRRMKANNAGVSVSGTADHTREQDGHADGPGAADEELGLVDGGRCSRQVQPEPVHRPLRRGEIMLDVDHEKHGPSGRQHRAQPVDRTRNRAPGRDRHDRHLPVDGRRALHGTCHERGLRRMVRSRLTAGAGLSGRARAWRYGPGSVVQGLDGLAPAAAWCGPCRRGCSRTSRWRPRRIGCVTSSGSRARRWCRWPGRR